MSYVEDYVSRLNRLRAMTALGVPMPVDRPASKSDLANLILQKARSDFSVGELPSQPKKEDKSILDRGKSVALGVLDVLSRPLYAAAGAADELVNPTQGESVLGEAWKGFKGADDTDFIDVLQKRAKRKVEDDPEYIRTLQEYGPKEAEWYKGEKLKQIESGRLSETGLGLAADLALDPLNLVGSGLVKKPIDAARNILKSSSKLDGPEDLGALAGREAATGDVPEVVEAPALVPAIKPVEGDIPSAFTKGPGSLTTVPESISTQVEMPRITGKFSSNRRPPVKTIEGQQVKADFKSTILSNPRYATLADVFNKDLNTKDFTGLQKARVVNETAQVVDQVAKGNPATGEFLSKTRINPLTPVARQEVDNATTRIIREIDESIANPAKARAAGKQPRHPVFNAPTQNNLSNKLTTAARNAFKAETINPRTGSGVSKPAAPNYIPAVYERYINMLRNAEEAIVETGRNAANDKYYPRAGIKPDSPYLRLSDVLDRLPLELARKTILGPNQTDKVFPSVLLQAISGDAKALNSLQKNKELFKAVKEIDWAPLMVKEHALRVIDATNNLKPLVDNAGDLTAANRATIASDTSKAAVGEKISEKLKSQIKNEMPSVKGSFSDLLSKMTDPKEDIIEQIIDRRKIRLAAGVAGGKNGLHTAQAPRIEVSSEITAQALKAEINPEATTKTAATDPVAASAAAEYGIFGTVLTWIKPGYGYMELRPQVLKNVSVRKASAATRAAEFTKILNMVPKGEHMDFWKEAAGILPVAPNHAAPVAHLQKAFGNLFGESGLEKQFAGNTVISRAGISIHDLNKHLRIAGVKDFQFLKEVPDPLTGKSIKLDSTQMLTTWRNYIPKNEDDLRRFVFGLTQATENVMVEYSTFAQLGAIWGSKNFKQNYVKVSDMHPAINDMYFPKDIVSQIGGMARGIDEFYEPLSTNQFIKLYDQGLRTWKSGVTIYAPSHHIRNMVGDMFMGWLDGLSNPIYYQRSSKMMLRNHNHYSDVDPKKNPMRDLLGEGRESEIIGKIMGQTQKRIPSGDSVIAKVRINGKRYQITTDQAYQMAFRHGLLPHSNIIEDLPGSETLMESLAGKFHPGKAGVFQPFGGKVQRAAREVSESREHFARLAHWLYALENTKAKSLEELFEKSAGRVRKYHPDGLDLTVTEKRVMRRLFPFYAWTRKAIPLVLEGIVTDPAKIMAYPKVASAMQEQQGIDSSVSDPWPEDQLFPDWLTGNVIGPIYDPQSALSKAIARSDNERGYTIVNPGNPATDILEDYFNNPIKGIGNSVTPFAKIPAELAFGREYQSGAPIADKTEYVDKNIPILATISRLTSGAVGTGLVEGGDLKGKETKPYNLQALLNYLTGAGILDTGRYTKGGEFDLKDRIRKQREEDQK